MDPDPDQLEEAVELIRTHVPLAWTSINITSVTADGDNTEIEFEGLHEVGDDEWASGGLLEFRGADQNWWYILDGKKPHRSRA